MLSGLNVATAEMEIMILICFGLLFIIGVIVMDTGGVLPRRNAAK